MSLALEQTGQSSPRSNRCLQPDGFPMPIACPCGKNKSTFEELERIKDRSKVSVVPLPEQSARAMAMILLHADCLFARPGAGMTTEALACGTPTIFDASRGVMPQETNNLNFWKTHAPSLVTTARPSRLPELVTREIPSVRISMDSAPRKLIDALDQLSIGNDQFYRRTDCAMGCRPLHFGAGEVMNSDHSKARGWNPNFCQTGELQSGKKVWCLRMLLFSGPSKLVFQCLNFFHCSGIPYPDSRQSLP